MKKVGGVVASTFPDYGDQVKGWGIYLSNLTLIKYDQIPTETLRNSKVTWHPKRGFFELNAGEEQPALAVKGITKRE